MTELRTAVDELENAKLRPKLPLAAVAGGAALLLIAAAVVLLGIYGAEPLQGDKLGAFPIEGSWICSLAVKDYYVNEGTYLYEDGDDLVLVSDGMRTTITPQGGRSLRPAEHDYFVSAPGSTCWEDTKPQEIMDSEAATGVIRFAGRDYVYEPSKVKP